MSDEIKPHPASTALAAKDAEIARLTSERDAAMREREKSREWAEWLRKRHHQTFGVLDALVGAAGEASCDDRVPAELRERLGAAVAMYEPPTYADGGKLVETPHAEVERLRSQLSEARAEHAEQEKEIERLRSLLDADNAEARNGLALLQADLDRERAAHAEAERKADRLLRENLDLRPIAELERDRADRAESSLASTQRQLDDAEAQVASFRGTDAAFLRRKLDAEYAAHGATQRQLEEALKSNERIVEANRRLRDDLERSGAEQRRLVRELIDSTQPPATVEEAEKVLREHGVDPAAFVERARAFVEEVRARTPSPSSASEETRNE